MTLVEVIAAIAIIGTILVGVVLAKSRHTRQLALAERKLVAIRALDEQLSSWWAGESPIPRNAQGQLALEDTATSQPLLWRTRMVPNGPIDELPARVVRVEVLEGSRDTAEDQPLVVVDLVLPRDESVEGSDEGVRRRNRVAQSSEDEPITQAVKQRARARAEDGRR